MIRPSSALRYGGRYLNGKVFDARSIFVGMLRLLTRPRPLRASSVSPASSSLLRLHVRNMATEKTPDFNKPLYTPLAQLDPEVQNIIDKETWRQFTGLELIASENLTSLAAMEANGSMLTNKYSEGLPNARYYGGNEYIDELEILCRKRALQAFNLDPAKWGVNVQPYSGSSANFAVLTALLQPQDRLMGLALPDGGHLTHGYYTSKKKMTASSIYFQSLPYALVPETQLIDYDGIAAQAKIFKPRLIICGASAYPRDWDYATLKKTADREGAWLMADIAHTSGLIAAQTLKSPFEYCDVVTTTTHKTLRGPRAGLIFFRKDLENAKDLEKRVNDAVFPACQGGPHNNTIAGIATALLQVAQPSFRDYAKQVIANAQALAETLVGHGYKLQTGGTDNHFVLWDLRPLGLTGSKVSTICDLLGITINKNAVSGDASAQAPGGIRIGTSAVTSRNMLEADVKVVADFLHRAVQLSLLLQKEAGSKLLKDFQRVATVQEEGKVGFAKVRELRDEVRVFASKWPLPGVDVATLTKPAGIHD
ncbi:serine hydroxymethyltransferase-domain-containing protein [Mycena maculata]|uniref:Serine hydroxymethyltransferase n=1 Tax=Mycena maculata TaxID=230809 RepID=A0AAD7HY97_9AGAR|nr:serine hydroxymethyltransferase-domain-containing protein [Mycena maculata]